MSTLKLKAELKGTGRLNGARLFLEKLPGNPQAMPLNFKPVNTGLKAWVISSTLLEVHGNLDIFLIINAQRGTGWHFSLIDTVNNTVIYQIEGVTGSDPSVGLNFSIVQTSI